MIDELTWRFMSTVMESENYSDFSIDFWFFFLCFAFLYLPGIYGDIKKSVSKVATNFKYTVSVIDLKH